MMNWIRVQIGKRMIYWGFRTLPPRVGDMVADMISVGLEWHKAGRPQKFECTMAPKGPKQPR